MKELSIEEKAKAYDEAIEYANYLINERCKEGTDGSFHRADLQKMFPQLEESEDEKIRKYLINQYKGDGCLCGNNFRISYEDIRAWLEKQGEHANFRNKIQIGDKVTRNKDGVLVNLSQLNRVAKKDEKQDGKECTCQLNNLKSNIKFPFKAKVKSSGVIVTIHGGQLSPDGKEWIKYQSDIKDKYKVYEPNNLELVCEIEQNLTWSEEDERIYNRICDIVHNAAFTNYDVDEDGKECGEYAKIIGWFKDLKDRVQSQPKQEWSEETQQWIDAIIKDYEEWYDENKDHQTTIQIKINILKSLKERYTWKPSSEQMYILNWVANILLNHDSVVEKEASKKLQSLYNDLKKLRKE